MWWDSGHVNTVSSQVQSMRFGFRFAETDGAMNCSNDHTDLILVSDLISWLFESVCFWRVWDSLRKYRTFVLGFVIPLIRKKPDLIIPSTVRRPSKWSTSLQGFYGVFALPQETTLRVNSRFAQTFNLELLHLKSGLWTFLWVLYILRILSQGRERLLL